MASFDNFETQANATKLCDFVNFVNLSGEILCNTSLFIKSISAPIFWLYRFKVYLKPNLSLHSCKIYRMNCTIPKFEMARTKIDDFTSAESWAILPRKMVRGLDRVCCEIPWL